jgi:hypothetical protein
MRRVIAGSVAALLTVGALRALPAQIAEEEDGFARRFMLACNTDGSYRCAEDACDSGRYCCK